MMEENKTTPLAFFTVAQIIAGMAGNSYSQAEPKSKFYTEPAIHKSHNYPEPREHTHGLEPKPRSKRKVLREKQRLEKCR